MSDFALVVYNKDDDKKINKSFLDRIKNIFIKNVEPSIYKSLFFNGLNGYIIELPMEFRKISNKDKFYIEYANRIQSSFSDTIFILQDESLLDFGFKGIIKESIINKSIFKSIIIDVISEIYKNKDIDLSDLEVGIIQGSKKEEVLSLIKVLSTYFKCITVFDESNTDIEGDLNTIYEETGLSVGISNISKSNMENIDMLINLSNLDYKYKLPKKTLIINYSEEAYKKSCDNILINNIKIGIPKGIVKETHKAFYDYLNKDELANILLYSKLGTLDGNSTKFDISDIQNISKAFNDCGFYIEGFQGRRNTFKAQNIKIS